MDEFVKGVKAVESEWLAVLGRTLAPVFYRKMPLRLAKKLSAGFQDKESKPQVYINCYEISMAKWHMYVNMQSHVQHHYIRELGFSWPRISPSSKIDPSISNFGMSTSTRKC